MEHIAAFLLLVSCPDGAGSCREVPAPTAAYETVQACERDREAVIAGHTEGGARKLGKCVEIDPALFYENAEIVWDITNKGELVAEVVTDDPYQVTRLGDEATLAR